MIQMSVFARKGSLSEPFDSAATAVIKRRFTPQVSFSWFSWISCHLLLKDPLYLLP